MATTAPPDPGQVRITRPGRVLYPAAPGAPAVTKATVIEYYRRIAPLMLAHIAARPVTRKRWPQGTDGSSFFEKQLPAGAPEWLTRAVLRHSAGPKTYPVFDSPAALVWAGQQGALELHTPQWRLDLPDPQAQSPGDVHGFLVTRLVFDLDPGPGTDLTDCARVAGRVREIVEGAGWRALPVTSGSKGIHLYVPLPRAVPSAAASRLARRVAEDLARAHPDEVTATMARSARIGKVLIDWSQNNGAKTTVAPYSLRGRARPTVAAPRTWAELDGADLRQLTADEVLARADEHGDLLAELVDPIAHEDPPAPVTGTDPLATYRARRDPARTPEPVPAPAADDASAAARDQTAGTAPIFVIQEHHARRLHWDFRLERGGVLVSWALTTGLPETSARNRLAVPTEDHPLAYADFAGTIPRGQYGAGTVAIWDRGTYDTVSWSDEKVVVDLHGDRVRGRFALFATGTDRGEQRWMIHKMDSGPDPPTVSGGAGSADRLAGGAPAVAMPRGLAPMLASPGTIDDLDPDRWAFEGKWDGYRVLAEIDGLADPPEVSLRSRSGRDITAEFARFTALGTDLTGHRAVLDGELVALDAHGVPDFALLGDRTADTDLRLLLFDVLFLDSRALTGSPYQVRRQVLEALAPLLSAAEVPPVLSGDAAAALADSRARGLEGVVAKRRGGHYLPGRRGDGWIKHKHLAADEVVIGGYTPGRGMRQKTIGALLLGVPDPADPQRLRYVGKVGTGFSDAELVRLRALLDDRAAARNPFDTLPRTEQRTARWVRPELVGEVRHAGMTGGGRLRQPSWRGLRPDKTVAEVPGVRQKGH